MDITKAPRGTIELNDTLSLIRAHYGKDEEGFTKICKRICQNVEKQGNLSLALYIKGQCNRTNDWTGI